MAVQKYRERQIKPYLICNNVSRADFVSILFNGSSAFIDINKIPSNPVVVDTYKMYYENTQLRIYGHDSMDASVLVSPCYNCAIQRIDISEDLYKLYSDVLCYFDINVFVYDEECMSFFRFIPDQEF